MDNYEVEGAESADGSDNDLDLEELEISLYSAIHFEDNTETNDIVQYSNNFHLNVEGNCKTGFFVGETTADAIVNKALADKYGDTLRKGFVPVNRTATWNKESERTTHNAGDALKVHWASKATICQQKPTSKSLVNHVVQVVEELDDSDNELEMSESDDSDILGILDEHDKTNNDDFVMNVKPFVQVPSTMLPKESNIRLGYSKRNVRYYIPIKCYNCNEIGHLSKNCLMPKKVQVCILCAETGHTSSSCYQRACFNCEELGHNSKDCPHPRRNYNAACQRCKMSGHGQNRCPETWRQYHKTVSISGPIQPMTLGKRKQQSCYNCASKKHYGHECGKERMSHYLRVNSPFIRHYNFITELQNIGGNDSDVEGSFGKQSSIVATKPAKRKKINEVNGNAVKKLKQGKMERYEKKNEGLERVLQQEHNHIKSSAKLCKNKADKTLKCASKQSAGQVSAYVHLKGNNCDQSYQKNKCDKKKVKATNRVVKEGGASHSVVEQGVTINSVIKKAVANKRTSKQKKDKNGERKRCVFGNYSKDKEKEQPKQKGKVRRKSDKSGQIFVNKSDDSNKLMDEKIVVEVSLNTEKIPAKKRIVQTNKTDLNGFIKSANSSNGVGGNRDSQRVVGKKQKIATSTMFESDSFPRGGKLDSLPRDGRLDNFPRGGNLDSFPRGGRDGFPRGGKSDCFPRGKELVIFPRGGRLDSFPRGGMKSEKYFDNIKEIAAAHVTKSTRQTNTPDNLKFCNLFSLESLHNFSMKGGKIVADTLQEGDIEHVVHNNLRKNKSNGKRRNRKQNKQPRNINVEKNQESIGVTVELS